MKRILVIENDPDLLYILDMVLKEDGFDVSAIKETNDVVGLIDQVKPQLLLIDFSLNGINGGALCSSAKNSTATNRLPVIIFSAHSDKSLKASSFGCDEFIPKPFDVDNLLSTIRKLVAD